MIPLVLLDLDGTVVGSDGQVKECVWQAVEQAREAGIKLATCTGRPCSGIAQKVAQRLGPTNAHIFQNGALIAFPDGEVQKVFALKEATTRTLIEHARDLSASLEIYTPSTLFVERRTPLSDAHAKMIGVKPIVRDLIDVAKNEPVVRAQWVVSPEQLELVTALEVEGIQTGIATSPALKDTFFVSLTQKGVSKGSAAKHLAESMKVDLANVMGVGDSTGDMPMLDVVGHPVVMGNSPEALKERYDVVTGDVDDCGVVAALTEALSLKQV